MSILGRKSSMIEFHWFERMNARDFGRFFIEEKSCFKLAESFQVYISWLEIMIPPVFEPSTWYEKQENRCFVGSFSRKCIKTAMYGIFSRDEDK